MITDFIFDGRSLSSFGYMLVFENTEEQIDVSKIEYETIKGARNDRSYNVGYNYSENYLGTYKIIKAFCDDPDNQNVTDEEISELTRWLCRKQYKWFRFVDDNTDNNDEIWYKAYIQVQKDYIGANVIGMTLTINTNAPYGFSRIVEHEYNTSTFAVSVNTDEEGYIYPDVVIELNQGGTLNLTNSYEDRTTTLKNCVAGEIITLKGYDLQQIDSTKNHDYVRDFNYKFPRLCAEYNKTTNVFSVNLDCTITMQYREVRKVGLK